MNSELLNQLIDRAVAVLNQHIVPGGISDRDALSELYDIFDGPEYRVAIAAPPEPILAQLEPIITPVAWMNEYNHIISVVEKTRISDSNYPTDTAKQYCIPLIAAQPAPDADWLRKLVDEAIDLTLVLRKQLADMSAQRDSWHRSYVIQAQRTDQLVDGLANIQMSRDSFRRDAQIWRFFLTAQDETTPEHAAIVSAADGLFPVSDLSKVMELAMKGGQP